MSMQESSQVNHHAARTPRERLFRNRKPDIRPNSFGTIVRALWPDKPALNLAQRIGCTERAAQFYIDGERKISAQALAVIVNEIVG